MSTPLFKKLNYKAQPVIWIVNEPDSFRDEMKAMKEFADVRSGIPSPSDKPMFVLVFAPVKSVLDSVTGSLIPSLSKDTVLWFAYPKQTSKNYKCDYNRDKGWDVISSEGYQGVRMISIDDDWSALRFKKQ